MYESASRWLRDNAKYPFFLFFHTFEIHPPYDYDSFVPDSLKHITEEREYHHNVITDMARYDSGIKYVDRYMGRLVALLDSLQQLDNTYIVLTSDHGIGFSEHLDQYAGDPMHQHGQTLHREEVAVPLIIRGAGIPAGRRVQSVVRTIDIAPTLVKLCGLPVPTGFLGDNLLDLWTGEENLSRMAYSESVVSEAPERKSLVRWPFHYIFIPAYEQVREKLIAGESERRLYRMNVDPDEQDDVAADEPDIVDTLHKQVLKRIQQEQTAQVPRSMVTGVNEETLRKLRAMGYINY